MSIPFVCGAASSVGKPVMLVITADAGYYIPAAGGTIAGMMEKFAEAYLVRVTDHNKDSWKFSPEDRGQRTRRDVSILGVKEIISIGHRAGELASSLPTELRDRIIFHIRRYKPGLLFIRNPYADYNEVLDQRYAKNAAEEARQRVALENFRTPHASVGLGNHPELHYYTRILDPRCREPESSATFAQKAKVVNVSSPLVKKLKTAQRSKTINRSTAMRIGYGLESTGRRLPLLELINDDSVNRLVEINVRNSAKLRPSEPAANTLSFLYAGVEYQIPFIYLK